MTQEFNASLALMCPGVVFLVCIHTSFPTNGTNSRMAFFSVPQPHMAVYLHMLAACCNNELKHFMSSASSLQMHLETHVGMLHACICEVICFHALCTHTHTCNYINICEPGMHAQCSNTLFSNPGQANSLSSCSQRGHGCPPNRTKKCQQAYAARLWPICIFLPVLAHVLHHS